MALITPSASPPTARSFFPKPYRIPDKASPTKRPRLASTSSHLQSNLPSASSSSTSLDQIDVHQAREASTLRLFDVWSTLADRYSRPLDEDDIIDITTGEVVKDRGVLRGSRNWDIGCFADCVEEEEYEEEEEDDDVDELDSFANTGADDELDDVPVEVDGRRSPVTEIDPADAEDLKQFLEAERRRREICGSEEETECSDRESLAEGLVDPRVQDSVRSANTNTSPLGRSATQVEEEGSSEVEKDQASRRELSVFVDSGSDDELVNWDVDEASMIYRLPKKDDEDRDSDVEVIDPPTLHPSSRSPPRTKSKPTRKASKSKPEQSAPKSTPSKRYKPSRTQLQTPPQSCNSSTTPSEDYFLPPSPDHPSAQRSSSPTFFSHDDSSPTKPRQAKPHLRKFDSKPQRPAASHGDRDVLPPPIPRLDLAKMVQGKAPPKSKSTTKLMPPPRAKEKASQLASTSLVQEKPADQRCQDNVSESLSHVRDKSLAPKRSRSHVEVVIEQRLPFSTKTPALDFLSNDRLKSQKERKVSVTKSSAGARDIKGKGREIVAQDSQEGISEVDDESDDPITILSSSPISVSDEKKRSHSLKRQDPQSSSDAVLGSSTVNGEEMSVIEPPKLKHSAVAASSTSMGTRKRKRVASSSQFDAVDADDVQMSPVVLSTSQSKTAVGSDEKPLSYKRTDSIGSESSASTFPGEPKSRHKPTRKSRPITRSWSRSKPGSSDHDRGSSPASSQEDFGEPHRHSHRAPSHFEPALHSDPPYYAYHQPPYTPHHPSPHLSHMYPPIADPRAQYIISQAMHQLSALVARPWTPPTHGSIPYTPSHRHPGGPSSMYSTPTHHPHPYPYAYDPNLSRPTLPPDSPEVLSSPAVPGGSTVRRKSLVKRSRSRGRRVSFRVEERADATEIYSPTGAREREATSQERDQSQVQPGSESTVRKGAEGRGKATADVAESGSESEPELTRRGRSFSRAQTPGPPIRAQSSNIRLKSGSQSTTTTRRRSRT